MTGAEDVLELFDLTATDSATSALGPVAESVLGRLRDEPLTADELVRALGVDPAEASAALIELELAGRIALEDGVYRAAL